MIAEGDKVAVCFTAKGTHDGAFQGVPATGKHLEIAAMTVWRFVDGKIAEEWLFFNDLDLYRQLGLFKDLLVLRFVHAEIVTSKGQSR
jgi:steroid delta-isomerase-like uncharacterized protein